MSVLATTDVESDMISEQKESAMIEHNATNEAIIEMKANSAPSSTCQTNSSNCKVNVSMTGLATYDGTRTLDAVTSFQSSLHHHFEPRA